MRRQILYTIGAYACLFVVHGAVVILVIEVKTKRRAVPGQHNKCSREPASKAQTAGGMDSFKAEEHICVKKK